MSLSSMSSIAPSAFSRETFGFSQERIHELMRSIYERGDRIMRAFLLTHGVLALIFATYYGTWLTTFVVAGAATGMFLISATLMPRSFLTRCVAGISLQAFCALHIFQMHGLAEMHFFFFTALTMMIVYQDWRALWPGAILLIAQHIWFAVLAHAGTTLNFWDRPVIGINTLAWHSAIALSEAGICGYWCVILRYQTLREAFQQGALVESRAHIAEQLQQVQASEADLQRQKQELQKIQRQLEADIAERNRAEAALRASDDRFRSLIDATTQIVWTTKPDGKFAGEQPAWSAFTGQSFEQYQGGGGFEAIHPDDREHTIEVWSHALAQRMPCEFEHRIRRYDGVYRYMFVRAVPVRESDGSIREWIGVHDDVTIRKQAEADILRAKDAAEVANRAKSQFLANMSHELRTPLNAVIGYSEMLLEELEEEGLASYTPDLQKIRGAGKNLLTLINDILDLSKIEAGKMELFLETFDVALLASEAVTTLTPLAEKQHNRLVLDVAPNLGVINSDQTKMRQCLLNLVSNACKFTENGTVTVRVERRTEGTGEFALFHIADTGIGMTEEQRRRLFEPFQQADASTTRKYGGTGLGLAITARFCSMLGGTISVESALGQGSVFTLRFPVRYEAAQSVSSPTLPLPSDIALLAEEEARNVVLVIDDDVTARDLMQRYLNKEGYTVLAAASGEEGLAMARRVHPIAITLDVMMPGMNGWTVLNSLKADPHIADIPVIILTMVDDRNLGYTLGATEYMTKPIEWEKLTAVLGKYCNEESERSVAVL